MGTTSTGCGWAESERVGAGVFRVQPARRHKEMAKSEPVASLGEGMGSGRTHTDESAGGDKWLG
jgi:hypothetical protein